jgi:hypothetical protein
MGVSFLLWDGQDLTGQLTPCLAESGYTPPVVRADPAEELNDKQLMVESNLKWTTCARQNGFASIEDPAPAVADNWATYPEVIIPGKITADQLRALLAQCPVFDTAGHEACQDARANLKEGDPDPEFCVIYDPAVRFDEAAWGIDPTGASKQAADPTAWDQLAVLQGILEGSRRDFEQSQGGK